MSLTFNFGVNVAYVVNDTIFRYTDTAESNYQHKTL